ncbi:MAG: DUF3618 domain-containing protein [Gemmatimonadota bacterium]|nr:DUF3618 domain-containing protein [Gemmatimonadota bacterium]
MATSTSEVRRDIQVTRERMSDTIEEIERKLNVAHVVRNNALPALAIAAGAGFLFARSSRRTKGSAGATVAGVAARASMGGVFESVAERLFGGVADVLGQRVDGWVDDLRDVIVPDARDAGGSARDGLVDSVKRADAR